MRPYEAGIGHLVLVDPDSIEKSNINRQLHATVNTIGQSKVLVMKERILNINPAVKIEARRERYTPEHGATLIRPDYTYIIDAVDDVSAKVDLIVRAKESNIPIISSMGAGNRLNASGFCIADISETSGCPLARVLRRRLRKLGITTGVKVVFSPEPPLKLTYNQMGKEADLLDLEVSLCTSGSRSSDGWRVCARSITGLGTLLVDMGDFFDLGS